MKTFTNFFFPFLLTDINECLENPSICGDSECENSYGTYRCIELPTTTTTTTTTTEKPAYEETTAEEVYKYDKIANKIENDDKDEGTEEGGNSEENENDDREDENESRESVTKENVDREINKIPEASSRQDEDVDEENSAETSDIDNEIPEAVYISHSTPEPVKSTTTTEDSSFQIHSTTITHRYAASENENESGENSANENEDNDDNTDNDDDGIEEERHHSDHEEEYTRMHHQSSTVKSDQPNECDDGLRLDDTGNCIGEYLLMKIKHIIDVHPLLLFFPFEIFL